MVLLMALNGAFLTEEFALNNYIVDCQLQVFPPPLRYVENPSTAVAISFVRSLSCNLNNQQVNYNK